MAKKLYGNLVSMFKAMFEDSDNVCAQGATGSATTAPPPVTTPSTVASASASASGWESPRRRVMITPARTLPHFLAPPPEGALPSPRVVSRSPPSLTFKRRAHRMR